jgi:hypothetical protein
VGAVRKVVALATVALVLACADAESVERGEWLRMTEEQKVIYVQSLLGAEKVKERKGGTAKVYALPAAEYVKKIDAAYAAGDARSPEQIFAGL